MPYVAPSTIDDINAKQRKVLLSKMQERTVLGYAFSWTKLLNAMRLLQNKLQKAHGNLDLTDEQLTTILEACVAAFREDEVKELRNSLNEDILTELKLSGIKTLEECDPFGRVKHFMVMEGTSPARFDKQVAMDLFVTKLKVPAKKVAEVYAEATVPGKKFTTLQVRDAKGEKE